MLGYRLMRVHKNSLCMITTPAYNNTTTHIPFLFSIPIIQNTHSLTPMAYSSSMFNTIIVLYFVYFFLLLTNLLYYQRIPIDPTEQQALYTVLKTINSDYPWPTLFPSDLCLIPPPGVVCDYSFFNFHDDILRSHVLELNFGNCVSDDGKPTIPCSHNATLNPILFTPFNYLRKLTFHKVTGKRVESEGILFWLFDIIERNLSRK
jgi:hypothetical protein